MFPPSSQSLKLTSWNVISILESISLLNREYLVKNCDHVVHVLWSRSESSPCSAREFWKSSKFPRLGKYIHGIEGRRVQGNLSFRSSSLPHCTPLSIAVIITSREKLRDTLLENNCSGRRSRADSQKEIISQCVFDCSVSNKWKQPRSLSVIVICKSVAN